MRLLLPFVLILVATIGIAAETDHADDKHAHAEDGHSDTDSSHKASLGAVHLLHAWVAETEADEVLVFVEIENEGAAPVTLLGAEAEIAETVDLVGFQMSDGQSSYVSLPMLPIAGGATMELAPNAAAFLMTGVTEHLHEGDAFEMHVLFDAGEVAMMVQVEAEGAAQHSHAGHNH